MLDKNYIHKVKFLGLYSNVYDRVNVGWSDYGVSDTIFVGSELGEKELDISNKLIYNPYMAEAIGKNAYFNFSKFRKEINLLTIMYPVWLISSCFNVNLPSSLFDVNNDSIWRVEKININTKTKMIELKGVEEK